jgi:hypothetical protein
VHLAMLARMSQSKVPISPFLEIEDAWILAGVINRFAASFDAKEALSLPEARVIFVLLVQAMNVLVSAYPDDLKDLVSRAMLANDDSSGPDDSN